EYEPCNECSNCLEMNSGRSIDIVEIDAASNTGVDNVRDNIIDAIRFIPNKGKFKVFVIDEVHMLSTSAFNALLKTLEEPPAYALFILATTEIHKIPATILSRCQRFDFKRIDSGDMIKRLRMLLEKESVKVSDDVLDAIVRISEGCLRDAESLLGQVLALGEKEIDMQIASLVLPAVHFGAVIDILTSASENQIHTILKILEDYVQQGGSIKHLINELIDASRLMMMSTLSGSYKMTCDAVSEEKIRNAGRVLGTKKCIDLINRLVDAKVKPVIDASPQLPLEVLFVDFCDIAEQKESLRVEIPSDKIQDEQSLKVDVAEVRVEKTEEKIKNIDATEEVAVIGTEWSINDLASKWGRVCEAVRKRNVALPLVLQGAKPLRMEDGKVVLGFTHEFHCETIKESKNSLMLIQAIEEVMQSKVDICIEKVVPTDEKIASNLADAFGGAVIG
ncbi:DNA polymerase III subunit gamma/tau, partial [Patescibacteria group bacterium]|nr:DNA polymerase III subunit gamma/tau [Patescibacteria group bacterium]